MTTGQDKRRSRKRLLTDCLVLLVSLVLTEPATTKRQQAEIAKLIRRLKREVA